VKKFIHRLRRFYRLKIFGFAKSGSSVKSVDNSFLEDIVLTADAPIKTDYLVVDGVKTRYRVAGVASQLAPVVFFHGIGRSLEDYSANLTPLSSERQVYAVDQIGYGRTEKPLSRSYTFNDLRDFALAFLDSANIKRAVFGGNSLGGAVALLVALHQPERVAGLVLTAPAGCGRLISTALRLCTVPILGEFLTRHQSPRADDKHLEGPRKVLEACFYNHSFVTEERIKHDYELSLSPNSSEVFLKTLRASCNWRGAKDIFLGHVLHQLPRVNVPTLVVWGKQDHVLPMEYAENTKRIPGAQVYVLDKCGHFPQLERADTFNSLAQKFLRENRL
jgi:pimeloyl-ACP methyl ester carboxylesterase